MVSYVNVHAILEGRRAHARASSSELESSQVSLYNYRPTRFQKEFSFFLKGKSIFYRILLPKKKAVVTSYAKSTYVVLKKFLLQ